MLSFGTVFLHNYGHAGLATITATMVFIQVGAMAMRVWSGRWTDRRRNRPAYLRACGALSVSLFAAPGLMVVVGGPHAGYSSAWRMAHGVGDGLGWAGLGVSGVCVSAWHGVGFTELATLAGAERAGTALGMASASSRHSPSRTCWPSRGGRWCGWGPARAR